MTKKKFIKEHWKNKWTSVNEELPPIGAMVITVNTDKCPVELDYKGNLNQLSDGDWYHIDREGRPTWWKYLTPEEFNYYQDLAIQVYLEGLDNRLYGND